MMIKAILVILVVILWDLKRSDKPKVYKCPECKTHEGIKVLYWNLFPMKICQMEGCIIWGFWSFLLNQGILPYTGYWFAYEGSYIKAVAASIAPEEG